MALIELILKGGIFLYPIIICSIIALAVFLERLWLLRRCRIIPKDFVRNVEECLKKQKISDAMFLSGGYLINRQNFLFGLKKYRPRDVAGQGSY